nr:metallophosphoesterase family protein [Anaerolineae bacterium]
MKILTVSDKVSKAIYSSQIVENFSDIDLVIGCGDLPYYYLEYIVTMLPVPVAYVFGNHDGEQAMADGRTIDRPEGCISLEGQVVNINGLLIGGLGGSIRYSPRAKHQYTEAEMRARVVALLPQLIANRIRYGRMLDILVTHSPPLGIHDGDDLPHKGFKSFLTLLRYAQPRIHLHGHKHVYRRDINHDTIFHNTTVVNVYPSRVIKW